jgi:hypothetical protein
MIASNPRSTARCGGGIGARHDDLRSGRLAWSFWSNISPLLVLNFSPGCQSQSGHLRATFCIFGRPAESNSPACSASPTDVLRLGRCARRPGDRLPVRLEHAAHRPAVVAGASGVVRKVPANVRRPRRYVRPNPTICTGRAPSPHLDAEVSFRANDATVQNVSALGPDPPGCDVLAIAMIICIGIM